MKWRVFIYLFRFSCIIKEMYLTFYLYYILLQFSVSLLVVTLARCIFWPTSCGENPQKVLTNNYMERWTKSLVFLFIKGFLFSPLELLFTNVVPHSFFIFCAGSNWVWLDLCGRKDNNKVADHYWQCQWNEFNCR